MYLPHGGIACKNDWTPDSLPRSNFVMYQNLIGLQNYVSQSNSLLNSKVPIYMSSFFILYQNREICPVEIKRLGLNKREATFYVAETWEAQDSLRLICRLYSSRNMSILSFISKMIHFNICKGIGDD